MLMLMSTRICTTVPVSYTTSSRWTGHHQGVVFRCILYNQPTNQYTRAYFFRLASRAGWFKLARAAVPSL